MAVTYGDIAIFGTGPQRVLVGPGGAELRKRWEANASPKQAGSVVTGQLERTVIVRGRLIGATHAAVETQRATLESAAKAEGPPAKLTDSFGRTWNDMLFVRITFGVGSPGRGTSEGFETGRDVSLSFEAEFRKVTELLSP